jgi:hypothetical protein
LKEVSPESFGEAVEVDEALRKDPDVRNSITKKGGRAFLHRSRVALKDVDFSETDAYEDIMAQECEGLCGI